QLLPPRTELGRDHRARSARDDRPHRRRISRTVFPEDHGRKEMSPFAWEVLDLVARWVHVIAGIMWVGNSLLFNWLDRNLHSKPEHYQGTGAIWLLHSGGFYYVEKTLLPGQKLPIPLHWFKWQAYTTWLTGLALLVIVYWAGGRATLGAPVGDQPKYVAVAAGLIVAGWATYELMNRFVAPRLPALSLVGWLS